MLEPGTAVQVLFPETGRSFPGTIRQARNSEDNDELIFDVEYAEPVNGKYVVDQCVPASRVTAMSEEERKVLARQKKAWAQEVRKGASGLAGTGTKRVSRKTDDLINQDDAASISVSVAPSDVTARTSMSSASARPRRASVAAAKANMLVGDEMDEILDDMEQAERAEAGEKAGTADGGKHKAMRGAGKGTALPGTEGVPMAPGEQMFEEDVKVEELEGGEEALSMSGLTAKDFISRILKKVESTSSAAVRSSSSSRMETDGDVFEGSEAEEEEQGCVLTAQEIVQLNEVLTAKQVHLMLQAVHAKTGKGSNGGGGDKKKKQSESSAGKTISALVSPADEGKDEEATGAPSSLSAEQTTPNAMDVEQEKDDDQEEEDGDKDAGAFSVNTKTGENSCRMLTAQLCAFITHDSEIKADIQKAYLETLPEPKEPVVEDDDDDLASTFLGGGKGRGGKGKGKAKKKANEGELVASTAGHHPVQWLRVQNQGGQLLLRNRALLGAAASLLRILAISSLMSSVEVTVGADKTVERALCAVTDFLKANFGSLSWRNKLGISSRAYSRMEEQLVMVVIRTTGFACLPLIRSVMGAAQCLLASRAQSTAITTACIRLAFAAMEADPHCSLNAACLEFSPASRSGSTKKASTSAASQVHAQVSSAAAAASTAGGASSDQRAKEDAALVARGSQMSPLLALHSSARSLLQCLGQRYPATRGRIVEDMIQLLSAVYVGDDETSHRKLRGQYQVHHTAPPAASTAAHALGFSGNPRFVSDALALLLSFVQSAGMPEAGTSSVRRRSAPSESYVDASEEPTSSANAGKGKSKAKGKGKGKARAKGKAKGGKQHQQQQQQEEEDDSYYTNLRKTAPKTAGQGDWSWEEMRSLETNPYTSGPVLMCRLFVKELLDRCETPELCAEYREVCLCLLQELAVVLPSPRFPCAGILMDMLRVRVSAVLTSEGTGVTENRPQTDPQSQLIVFYMEVLSRMTTMQLCVRKTDTDQERLVRRYGLAQAAGDSDMADDGGAGAGMLLASDYNSNVVRAMTEKVRSGQEAWLALLRGKSDVDEPTSAGAAAIATATATATATAIAASEAAMGKGAAGAPVAEAAEMPRSSRRTRSKAADTKVEQTVMDVDPPVNESGAGAPDVDTAAGASSLRRKLTVLESLCCMAVDAVSEYLTPQQCTSTEYVDRHFALCAYPFALLSLVGAGEEGGVGLELRQALQGVCTRDLHQYLVCEYTRKRMQSTRSSVRDSISSPSSLLGPALLAISSGDSESECVLSAYHMLLALWQRDALIEEYHEAGTAATDTARPAGVVAACAEGCLNDLRRQAGFATSTSMSTSTGTCASTAPAAAGDGYDGGVGVCVEGTKAVLERPSRQLHTLHSWIQTRYSALTTRRFVAQQCSYLLELLLHLMGQPAGAVRAKSIRTFGRLFTVDSAVLLSRHDIRSAVAERLSDVEIKVREEATKVLGQALKNAFSHIKSEDPAPSSSASASAPTLPVSAEEAKEEELCVDEYINPLLECLRDKATSVRKAAVHVLRDILLHAPLHPMYPKVCLELASRAKQEEGNALRDVIRASFQQLWFTRSAKKCIMHYLLPSPSQPQPQPQPQPQGYAEEGEGDHDGDIVPPAPGIVDAMDVDNTLPQQQPPTQEATFTHAEDVAAHLVQVMALLDVMGASEAYRGDLQASLTELVRELTHGQFSAISEAGDVSVGPEAEGASKVNKSALSAAKRQFEEVSAALVEYLVRLEERDATLLTRLHAQGAGTIVTKSGAAIGDSDLPAQMESFSEAGLLVATISALQLMCHAMPALLTSKVSTLLPYLQAHSQLSNAQQARVALMVMEMTTSVVSSLASSKGVAGHAATSVSSVYQAATGNGMGTAGSGPSMVDNAIVHSLPGIAFAGLMRDLQNIIFRGPSLANINSAIRCMATITSHVTEDAGQFMMIGTKCFNILVSVAGSARGGARGGVGPPTSSSGLVSVTSKSLANTQRALAVLGALCEHSRLCFPQLLKLALTPGAFAADSLAGAASAASAGDEERLAVVIRDLESSTARLPLRESNRAMTPLTINGSCYRAAVFALSIDDMDVQTRAVQALCQSFIGCPRLAFAARDSGLFSSLLDAEQRSAVFIERFLMGMNSVMVLDETRTNLAASETQAQQPPGQRQQQESSSGSSSSTTGKGAVASGGMDVMALMMAEGEEDDDDDEENEGWSEVGQNVLSASTHDADTTATGAVCVQHKDTLLSLLTHRSQWLRLASLRIVATLLRQGILCPLDAVASLVCMQSDSNATLRSEAVEILVLGDRKHPTFLDNRVVNGLEMAFDAQVEQVRNERLDAAAGGTPAEQWEALHSPITAADMSPIFLTTSTSPALGTAGSDGASVMMGEGEAEHPAVVHSNFGDLYRQCFLAGGKKRTDAFLTSVLRAIRRLTGEMKTIRGALVADSRVACDPASADTAQGTAARARLLPDAVDLALSRLSHASGTCQYLMSILAHLPYESMNEPLQIIAWLRRHVAVDTALVADELMTAVNELSQVPVAARAAAVSPSSDADAAEGQSAGLQMVTPVEPKKGHSAMASPPSYLRWGSAADSDVRPPTAAATAATATSASAPVPVSAAKGTKKGTKATRRAVVKKRGAGKAKAAPKQSKRRRTSRSGGAAADEEEDGEGKEEEELSEEEEEEEEEEEDWDQQSAASLVSSMSSRSHSHTAHRARAAPLAPSIALHGTAGAAAAASGGMTLDESMFLRWVDGYCRSQGRGVGGLAGRGARVNDALRREEADMASQTGTLVGSDDTDKVERAPAGTGEEEEEAASSEVAKTSGLAVAAVVLMGGEEARIREALLLLRQWLMRLYRLSEDRCTQYESSASATGRNKVVKDASNAANKEAGSLLQRGGGAGGSEELDMHSFESFLSGASSVPSFGYGSNIHVAVSPSGSSPSDSPGAGPGVGSSGDGDASATPFIATVPVPVPVPVPVSLPTLLPTGKKGVPHHSCIFSSLGSSPQTALEAVKSSIGSIGKMTHLATTQEVPAAQRKRSRR